VARRSPAAACDRIAELARNLAQALEYAADADTRASRDGMSFVGRGTGFSDGRPTETAALAPRHSQLRRAARRAGFLVAEAEATLEAASNVIASAYLRLDPEEWIRATEKRRAALGQ